MANLIKQADAIYSKPIIKCKDCKYYYWEQEPWQGEMIPCCALGKGLAQVKRETFCSYGEKGGNDEIQ